MVCVSQTTQSDSQAINRFVIHEPGFAIVNSKKLMTISETTAH